MSKAFKITAETTVDEYNARRDSDRRAIERKVMADMRRDWSERQAVPKRTAVHQQLWRTVDGLSDRVCTDCRDRMIDAGRDLLGQWMVIVELTPAQTVAGLAHCDSCGVVVPVTVQS